MSNFTKFAVFGLVLTMGVSLVPIYLIPKINPDKYSKFIVAVIRCPEVTSYQQSTELLLILL